MNLDSPPQDTAGWSYVDKNLGPQLRAIQARVTAVRQKQRPQDSIPTEPEHFSNLVRKKLEVMALIVAGAFKDMRLIVALAQNYSPLEKVELIKQCESFIEGAEQVAQWVESVYRIQSPPAYAKTAEAVRSSADAMMNALGALAENAAECSRGGRAAHDMAINMDKLHASCSQALSMDDMAAAKTREDVAIKKGWRDALLFVKILVGLAILFGLFLLGGFWWAKHG